jgi:hypothetical protein
MLLAAPQVPIIRAAVIKRLRQPGGATDKSLSRSVECRRRWSLERFVRHAYRWLSSCSVTIEPPKSAEHFNR